MLFPQPPADIPPALDESVFRSLLGDGPIAGLFDYWQGLIRADTLPGRKDIDPFAIKAILPDLYILQRGEDAVLRFRLTGTALHDLFGTDVTGKALDDVLEGRDLRNARRCYGAVDMMAAPWMTRIVYDLGQDDRYRYRRLVCPLASDGQHIDAYMGAFEAQDIYDPPRRFDDIYLRAPAILERGEAMLAR